MDRGSALGDDAQQGTCAWRVSDLPWIVWLLGLVSDQVPVF